MGLVPGIDPLLQSVIFVAFAGIPMAGVFTFPNALLADIIDYDAVLTGSRREALYYGVQNVLEKWTGSLMFPIFGALLLLGETVDNPLGIRLAGPVAGAAALTGVWFFRAYRLPDNVTPESVRHLTEAPARG
jgi:GPH family glycoside/pentoside/hexuronide:cation symporter